MSDRPRLYHFDVAQAMPAAWRMYRTRPSCYAVFSAMACAHMDGRTGETSIGAESIAKELAMPLRTVRAAIAQLVKDGWLRLISRGGGRFDGKAGRTTVYRICIPQQCSLDCTVTAAQQCSGEASNSAVEGSQQRSPDCTQSYISDISDPRLPAAPAHRGLFPGGEKSTQKNGNGKPAKAADRQPANYRQFTDFWLSEWRAAHGMAAPRLKQREWSNLAEIWKAVGKNLPEAQAVIRTYFADSDKFYEAHPVGKLLCELPKFILRTQRQWPRSKKWKTI